MQIHLTSETSMFPSFSEIAVLLVCLLAIGFMVWFLIALVRDDTPESEPCGNLALAASRSFSCAANPFFGADSKSEHLSKGHGAAIRGLAKAVKAICVGR